MARKASSTDVITASAFVLGNGPGKPYALTKGATVKELLTEAKIDLSNKESIMEKNSGEEVGLSDELEDGDIIVVTKDISSAE